MKKPLHRKAALWTTLRAGKAQLARAAKIKAAKREKKAGARRAEPRKRIPARSVNEIKRQAKYRPAREAHLAEFPDCEVCWPLIKADPERAIDLQSVRHSANQIHHIRGRSGSLLWDRRWFKSACADGHAFIGANPDIARKAKVLAEVGEWGKQP